MSTRPTNMRYTIEGRSILASMLLLLASGGRLMAVDSAVITDSGSTNTAGFRIEVGASGEAVYAPKPRRAGQGSRMGKQPVTRQVPSALLKRFFADLGNARPLASLPSQGCMKSVSFGTTLTIEYGDEKSPDLRCGDHGNAKLKALIQDSSEIIQLFGGN